MIWKQKNEQKWSLDISWQKNVQEPWQAIWGTRIVFLGAVLFQCNVWIGTWETPCNNKQVSCGREWHAWPTFCYADHGCRKTPHGISCSACEQLHNMSYDLMNDFTPSRNELLGTIFCCPYDKQDEMILTHAPSPIQTCTNRHLGFSFIYVKLCQTYTVFKYTQYVVI